MLGQSFYHETIRNVIVAFGTMFNNIQIVRKDNNGTVTQIMKVPLAYGPKQKFLTRLDQDPSLSAATAITLPRLGFEIGSLTYDTARKMNRVQKFKKVKSNKEVHSLHLDGLSSLSVASSICSILMAREVSCLVQERKR